MDTKDNENSPICTINIVPFVDITLVILIIFIITTPLMNYKIKINLPQSQQSSQTHFKNSSFLKITITNEGRLYLNGQTSSLSIIIDYAKNLKLKNPKVAAHIAADSQTPHGVVIEIIDSLKTLGLSEFNMIVNKK